MPCRNSGSRLGLRAVFALSVQGRYAAKVQHSGGGDTTVKGRRVTRRLQLRGSER
jgi:hypothetical protein